MVHRTAGRLREGQEGVFNNALVESYALHRRNLIEFLHGGEPRDDDVSAVHYMASKEAWVRARGGSPELPEALARANVRADKQVAHLTRKRFADGAVEQMGIPELEIPELLGGLRLFLQHADSGRLRPDVGAAAGRLASLIGEAV